MTPIPITEDFKKRNPPDPNKATAVLLFMFLGVFVLRGFGTTIRFDCSVQIQDQILEDRY